MRRRTLLHWTLGGMIALGAVATLGAGSARADLKVTYKDGPVAYPGEDPVWPNQAAINRNIKSPYYGYLYVSDYRGAAHDPNKGVRIWKPVSNGTGTTETYEDTGKTITIPDPVPDVKDGNKFDPFGVAVGPDDTVWIAGSSTGNVWTAPGLPTGDSTSVLAVQQITGVAFARSIHVSGPITAATVYTGSNGTLSKYTGSATSWDTTGTFTKAWTVSPGVTPNSPFDVATDAAGNAYVSAAAGAAGAPALVKIDKDGNFSTLGTIPANGVSTTANWQAAFVPDKSYKGGGYLYTIGPASGVAAGYRYDLDGNYLDGYGPALGTPPTNYTVVTGVSTQQYGFADDLGNTYQKFSLAGNGAWRKTIKMAPFVAAAGDVTSAGGAVKSSPTTVDGVVYFGSDDGYLYAYTAADGNPVAGFPKNISTAVGAAVKVQSRPSVYVVGGVKRIYFTTDRGDIGRVDADGSNLQVFASPIPTNDNTGTPAVTSDGTIYVGGSTALGAGVLKLNPDFTLAAFQQLGTASTTVSSVAVSGNNVYVGLNGGTDADIVVLKASDLTPQAAGVAKGEGVTAPPYVSGDSAYVGTLAGNFYKVNSVNFAPDAVFGDGTGKAAIGEALPGSAFNAGNSFYVGSANGKVWKVDGTSGAFGVFYDTGDGSAVIPGVVVNRTTNTLAFGTSTTVGDAPAGAFYEVPTDVTSAPVNAQVYQGYGPFTTTPTVGHVVDTTTSTTTDRFLIGSDDMNVYSFGSR